MNYVLELSNDQIVELITHYETSAQTIDVENTVVAFEGSHYNVSVYESKKVMFQGKKARAQYDYWIKSFDLTLPETTEIKTDKPAPAISFYEPSIGSDESGSGDYFGPLVVAAVYISKADENFLKKFPIKDSKAMDDKTIIEVIPEIIERIPYSLMILNNEKYNQMIEKGFNLNALKAYLHAQAHKAISLKVGKKGPIIVDQFVAPQKYYDYLKDFEDIPKVQTFMTQAETHYASVALSSMVARFAFLNQLRKLSKEINMSLQKGASSSVDEQIAYVIKTHGERQLREIAKVHFANTLKAKALIK
jgi:ribonuclease HIII